MTAFTNNPSRISVTFPFHLPIVMFILINVALAMNDGVMTGNSYHDEEAVLRRVEEESRRFYNQEQKRNEQEESDLRRALEKSWIHEKIRCIRALEGPAYAQKEKLIQIIRGDPPQKASNPGPSKPKAASEQFSLNWICSACTFENAGATKCQMCDLEKSKSVDKPFIHPAPWTAAWDASAACPDCQQACEPCDECRARVHKPVDLDRDDRDCRIAKKDLEKRRKKNKTKWNIAELPAFAAEVRKENFRIQNVGADGNCFYRALSLFLTGAESNYHWYRLQTINYMQAHWALQWGLGNRDAYIASHRVSHKLRLSPNKQLSDEGNGEYADNVNIIAASRRFNLNITLLDSEDAGSRIKRHEWTTVQEVPGFPIRSNPIGKVNIGRIHRNHFVLLTGGDNRLSRGTPKEPVPSISSA